MNRIALGLVAVAAFGLTLGGIGMANAGDDRDDDRPASMATESVGVDEQSAREIALRKVGGGTVDKVELESEDGGLQWHVDVVAGGTEYDVRIDANTGDVVRFRTDDGHEDAQRADDGHDDDHGRGHDDDHDDHGPGHDDDPDDD